MVQAKNYSIMTDEIDEFRRLNLFLIPIKTLKIWVFELHKIVISRKTNFSGNMWLFFVKSMVILLSVSKFSERLIKK